MRKNFIKFTIVFLITIIICFPIIKREYFTQGFESYKKSINGLENSTLVIAARYEDKNKNLISHNANKPIHIGSNYKLFTAATAFDLIDINYEFETKFYLNENKLFIEGGGDPSTTFGDIDLIAENLKPKLQNTFINEIVYINEFFIGEQYGPDWDEAWYEEHFAIPITSLQLNNGLSEDREFTIKEPLTFYAETLRKSLNLPNSKIREIQPDENKGELLYTHTSQTLDALIYDMLKRSRNNFAESLIRLIAKEIEGQGLQKNGTELMINHLKEKGVIDSKFIGVDGSGMSSSTRITANHILNLFQYINNQNWGPVYWQSLPSAQKDGTLYYRFENKNLKYEIRAKTGTHIGASSLSGRIYKPNGKDILFSIHVYEHELKREEVILKLLPLIDHIVVKISEVW